MYRIYSNWTSIFFQIFFSKYLKSRKRYASIGNLNRVSFKKHLDTQIFGTRCILEIIFWFYKFRQKTFWRNITFNDTRVLYGGPLRKNNPQYLYHVFFLISLIVCTEAICVRYVNGIICFTMNKCFSKFCPTYIMKHFIKATTYFISVAAISFWTSFDESF